MIALFALAAGSLLGTLSGSGVDVPAKDFVLPQEFFYSCWRAAGKEEAAGMFNVLLTPHQGATTVKVNFLPSTGAAEARDVVSPRPVRIVKRFGSPDAPTWYLNAGAAAGRNIELAVTPGRSNAVVRLRAASASFDRLDCMEQPPLPKAAQ